MGEWGNGRTGVVERAGRGLGVDVVGDPALGRVDGGEAGADFVSHVLFSIVVPVGPRLSVCRSVPTTLVTAYDVVPSLSGGTVASLWTASHAVSRSKSLKPFTTASATRESAWVPT